MAETTRETEFVALGHAGSEHYAGLETFPSPGIAHVSMTSDELVAVCPITGQPDFYTASIEYRPRCALPRVEVAEALPRDLPERGRLLRGARGQDPRRRRRGARAPRRQGDRRADPEGARRDHDHGVDLSRASPSSPKRRRGRRRAAGCRSRRRSARSGRRSRSPLASGAARYAPRRARSGSGAPPMSAVM